MVEIKIIPKELTYIVRQPVLRPGKSIETCHFEGDELTSTIHFGLYFDNNLTGVVSVFENKNDNFTEDRQLQVRGMAVLDEFQGKGFGKMLMLRVEQFSKTKNTELIWFNAREAYVNFYKNLGYCVTGNPFLIDNIGIHYLMFKRV